MCDGIPKFLSSTSSYIRNNEWEWEKSSRSLLRFLSLATIQDMRLCAAILFNGIISSRTDAVFVGKSQKYQRIVCTRVSCLFYIVHSRQVPKTY